MALTSGNAIAAFVANNVALRMVDNASLPPDQQDWLPVQAFVAAASGDAGVRRITIVDSNGIVRGASDPAQVGRHEAVPAGERLLTHDPREQVFQTGAGDLRVRRTVTYADRPFGKVELVVSSDGLNAALDNARNLLLGLAGALLLVVLVISYATAHMIARPLRQLRRALADAAAGKRDFRISHRRRDEFGELFDSFNALSDSLESAPTAVDVPAPAEVADIAVLHRRSA
jgi:serine/threonine-protein kinase